MDSPENIIIGTRSSQLALWQANFVKNELEKFFPGLNIELKHIKTMGDKILDKALDKIGDKGLFTKELENELLAGSIDLAVHSLKDLQTDIPAELKLAAVTKRHSVEDVLIAREKNLTISDLKQGATIATGSLRRKAQLLHLRPDFNIVDLRGNVTTRIKKFLDSDWDAIVLARAGVERIGKDKYISSIISTEEILPAVGQGALGIEIAGDNPGIEEILKPLNHVPTCINCKAERAFLKALGAGCKTPIAAYAKIIDIYVFLEGMVSSENGESFFREKISGYTERPVELGNKLAGKFLNHGANEII